MGNQQRDSRSIPFYKPPKFSLI